jgi:hypothetical protein
MDYGEFSRRFREDREIGCDLANEELLVFPDNGSELVRREDIVDGS